MDPKEECHIDKMVDNFIATPFVKYKVGDPPQRAHPRSITLGPLRVVEVVMI